MHGEHPPAKVPFMINICMTVAENKINRKKYSFTVVCSKSFSTILLEANRLFKPCAVIFRCLCTIIALQSKGSFKKTILTRQAHLQLSISLQTTSTVYNVHQVDGSPGKRHTVAAQTLAELLRLAAKLLQLLFILKGRKKINLPNSITGEHHEVFPIKQTDLNKLSKTQKSKFIISPENCVCCTLVASDSFITM